MIEFNSVLFQNLRYICYLGGIWSDGKGFWNNFYFKTIQIFYILTIFYMLASLHGTLAIFRTNMNIFGVCMIIAMSAFLDFLRFFVMKRPEFQQLIVTIFKEEKMLSENIPDSSIRLKHEKNTRFIFKLMRFYQVSVSFSVFTVFCLSFSVSIAFMNDKNRIENAEIYEKYILKFIYIPFSVSEHYILSHIFMNCVVYLSSFMVCMIDLIFMIPIWHLTLKLKILKAKLSNLLHNYDVNDWNLDVTHEIIIFIKEHQEIIRTFDKLKLIYWNVLLFATIFYGVQFAPAFLGLLYFENLNLDFTILIGGICYTFTQLFILHWQSQLLTDESLEISKSVYFESDWYRMNVKSRKLLIFMLIRSQKPLELFCGPFYPLNLSIFLQVLKRLYTFINIFKEMS